MKKIPTYFERNHSNGGQITSAVNPLCAWVEAGEGVATVKLDGACCMIADGRLFKRREIKVNATGTYPDGFILADSDETTGKVVGWVPVGDAPEDKWFREAFDALQHRQPGTYELLGPKVQGNPEGLPTHVLIRHDHDLILTEQPPRDFGGLRAWLTGRDIEGVVWHHPDGRMAKIKLRDFGLSRQKV